MFPQLEYSDEAESTTAHASTGRAQPAVAAHDLGDMVAEQIAAQLEGREPAAWATVATPTATPARAPAAQSQDLGDLVVAAMESERGVRSDRGE